MKKAKLATQPNTENVKEAEIIDKEIIDLRAKILKYIHFGDLLKDKKREVINLQQIIISQYLKPQDASRYFKNIKQLELERQKAMSIMQKCVQAMKALASFSPNRAYDKIGRLKKQLEFVTTKTGYEIKSDKILFCNKCNDMTLFEKYMTKGGPGFIGSYEYPEEKRRCSKCKSPLIFAYPLNF